jgi:AcrR family transcriptional regulator
VIEREGAGDPRDRLLQAAIVVFAESGFRGATTRRIAEAADVNEVTLFRLFGTKKALLEEAVAQSQAATGGAADAFLPDEPGDVEAELTAWARVHWRAMRERRAVIRKMMSEAEEHPHMTACLSDGWKRTHAAVERYLQRLRDRGDIAADVPITTAVSMLSGTLFADAMGRDLKRTAFPPERTAVTEYLTLFLRALGYVPRSPVVRATEV